MRRNPIESSNIASVGYEAGILEVEFHDGSVYRYYNVPMEAYVGLMHADSPGGYLHTYVKTQGYRYEKIGELASMVPSQASTPPMNHVVKEKPQPPQQVPKTAVTPSTTVFSKTVWRVENKYDELEEDLEELDDKIDELSNRNSWASSSHLSKKLRKLRKQRDDLEEELNDSYEDEDWEEDEDDWNWDEKRTYSLKNETQERIAKIQHLMEHGTDANGKDVAGMTLLQKALQNKSDVKVLEFLVSNGADVNVPTDIFSSPLHCAIFCDSSVEIVKYLVFQGANVSAKDMHGDTPLHDAAQKSNVEILKYLVSQRADVHARNNEGKTPLDVADTDVNKRILLEAMRQAK